MGMMLGSILILLGTAAVFSDEKQTNMQPLIFTTEQGKTRDIGAKIAAAFTVTAAIDGVILVLAFGLCRLVYGLDGDGTAIYFILRYTSLRHPLSYCPCSAFALITVLLALLGSAVLCGMTLWISARCASSFHALAAAAICWGAPFLVRIFFGGFGFLLVSGTPVFLVMTNNIWDIYSFWFVPLTSAILLLIGSVTSGYRVYKNGV